MKDAVHHLRSIQKKVLREVRKSNQENTETVKPVNNETYRSPPNQKKMDHNLRTPRILKNATIS